MSEETALTASATTTTTTSSSSGTSKKTIKKIVTEVVEESDESSLKESYRPSIASKNIVIQRGNYTSAPQRSFVDYRHSQYASLPAGSSLALIEKSGIGNVVVSRESEKKSMQDLNERLANYIEKARFLEAQNRRLADELQNLKAKWGKETLAVKAMYQAELEEARKLLEEANIEKGRLQLTVASLEEKLEETRRSLDEARRTAATERERADGQLRQLGELENELIQLRRRFALLEADRDKDKTLIIQLREQVQSLRALLDTETLERIEAVNRKQTLEEELIFIKTIHDQEMKELAALAYRDSTYENREYWKTELGYALREIQQTYDDKVDGVRIEMESFYNSKIQEVIRSTTQSGAEAAYAKEECKKLRSQITTLREKLSELDAKNAHYAIELDNLRREKEEIERRLTEENSELKSAVVRLRAELEAIMKELQLISDSKLGLELEIAAYRKLLEGEESRIGLRQIVDILTSDQQYTFRQTESTSGDSTRIGSVIKGEMSAKTTYQRSAKGPVAIGEIAQDGKFLQLENTGRKDEELGEWHLKRNIDGEDKYDVVLPKGFTLRAGEKVKLWAKGLKPADAGASDIEVQEGTWGVGSNVVISKLVNLANEERATHVQRTTFA